MIHLHNIISILIDIDQEAILRFLGIPDPYNSSFSNVPVDAIVPISTQVSVQTLKIVIKHLINYYKTGFGAVDIENIIFLITTIRFISYARRYNIKTAVRIAGISFFAAVLWYLHFRDAIKMFGPMMKDHRMTERFRFDMAAARGIRKANQIRDPRDLFTASGPILFLRKAIGLASRDGLYRIDPISMMVANIPDEYRPQADKVYYQVLNKLIPRFWALFAKVCRYLSGLFIYSTVVRVNKRRCPYFIRWHWTYIMVYSVIESEVVRLALRLEIYLNTILAPAGRQQEAVMVRAIILTIVSMNFFCLYIAMLHAACGQYFYVPFLTENTEIHIGRRPKNDIYSGGYTSWQEGYPKQIEWSLGTKKLIIPRVWWGWCGNLRYTSDKMEGRYRKRKAERIKKRTRKRIRKIIRKIRKWILRS